MRIQRILYIAGVPILSIFIVPHFSFASWTCPSVANSCFTDQAVCNSICSPSHPCISSTCLPVTGQGGGVTVNLDNPLGVSTINEVIPKIVSGLLMLAIPVVAIMVIVGGIQIMTAGGNEEKYKTGRNTILYAVIGLAAVLLAQAVVAILRNLIGGP